jgi:hypothetical protein
LLQSLDLRLKCGERIVELLFIHRSGIIAVSAYRCAGSAVDVVSWLRAEEACELASTN